MRPSQTGTHTSDKALFQKGLKKKNWPENGTPAPTLPRFFLERPTTQKGSKKSLRTQKVQKKPQVGTHTSDKGLSQKGLKKAWPEPTTRKGSKKSLRKQVGKKALTSKTNAYSHTGDTRAWVMVNHRKGSKKKPRRYRKNPARRKNTSQFCEKKLSPAQPVLEHFCGSIFRPGYSNETDRKIHDTFLKNRFCVFIFVRKSFRTGGLSWSSTSLETIWSHWCVCVCLSVCAHKLHSNWSKKVWG